ncbi:hypothetical protein M9H77_18018 [Catharanthus roseus]|uniref:Uncharacterized protein n=1 Tax=Catharanthus roseus TaxID=4058 RepID=A0ACC0B686_CATRO|nr:hypothetical protein M9H77_18018 [Catharanthus roseus]
MKREKRKVSYSFEGCGGSASSRASQSEWENRVSCQIKSYRNCLRKPGKGSLTCGLVFDTHKESIRIGTVVNYTQREGIMLRNFMEKNGISMLKLAEEIAKSEEVDLEEDKRKLRESPILYVQN